MIRVALFVPSGVAPPDSGMHIPALTNLVEHLSQQLELTVYSFSNKGWNQRELRIAKATVKFLPVASNSNIILRLYHLSREFLHDHLIQPFQIVHGLWGLPCGFFAVLTGKLLQIPTVVTFLGGETAAIPEINYGNMLSQPSKMLTLYTARHADKLMVLSRFQRKQLRNFGIERTDIEVIPLGVDTKQFLPVKSFIPRPPYQFIHVANLTEVKDQPTLLRAFRKILENHPSHLRIIGPDFLNGTLINLIEELGLGNYVDCLGLVPNSELPQYYNRAHILLHTSLHESQSISVVEALASGVVVCGTDVGLLSDLKDKICIVTSPKNVEDLAEKVLDIMSDVKTWIERREKGMQWARRHNIHWTVQRVKELYSKLVMNYLSMKESP